MTDSEYYQMYLRELMRWWKNEPKEIGLPQGPCLITDAQREGKEYYEQMHDIN